MKKLAGLPTWVLMNAAMTFAPSDHPWKRKWFSLEDWTKGRSDLCKKYDLVFWMHGFSFAVLFLFWMFQRK